MKSLLITFILISLSAKPSCNSTENWKSEKKTPLLSSVAPTRSPTGESVVVNGKAQKYIIKNLTFYQEYNIRVSLSNVTHFFLSPVGMFSRTQLYTPFITAAKESTESPFEGENAFGSNVMDFEVLF